MDDQIEQAPAIAPLWYLNQWIADKQTKSNTELAAEAESETESEPETESESDTETES